MEPDPKKNSPVNKESQGSACTEKSIVISAIRLGLWFVVFLAYLFLIPQFKRMFYEFGIELPVATKLVLAYTDRMLKLWFLIIPVLMVAVGVMEAIAIFLPPNLGSSEGVARKCLSWFAWGVLVLVIAFTVLGIAAPMMAIISGLTD